MKKELTKEDVIQNKKEAIRALKNNFFIRRIFSLTTSII